MAVERLCRLNVRVAEHPLHHAEIAGVSTKLGRERVSGTMLIFIPGGALPSRVEWEED